MCKFCDDLKNYKKYKIPIRNTYANDNTCEFVSPENYKDGCFYKDGISFRGIMNCEDCDGCKDDNYLFYLNSCNNYISIDFYHKIKDLTIAPCSESLVINFCPWCGKKISKIIIPFDQCCLGSSLGRDDYES